jgi:alanine racemase
MAAWEGLTKVRVMRGAEGGERVAEEWVGRFRSGGRVPRPAWVELAVDRLRGNFALINARKPREVGTWAVVKDGAYGHGAVLVGRVALEAGAVGLAVSTLEEAVELRESGIRAPILMLGERGEEELPYCIEYGVVVSVGEIRIARVLDRLAQDAGLCMPVHLKVDTGMNRFGVRWEEVGGVVEEIRGLGGLVLEGVMSHLAMSDEVEKTFSMEQVQRFERATKAVRGMGCWQRHVCNSVGFLDLPGAWFEGVRLGLLPLGVYPSEVCGRMEGLLPVMSVKARVVTVRELGAGESFGYGLRYRALERRRIAVLPVGYGDGYPRLVNQGEVLVRGKRAPVVGSVAMDAMGVDVTGVPEVEVGEEVVLMGEQGVEAITAREVARWGGTVCYDVLAGWRGRLPRIEMDGAGR